MRPRVDRGHRESKALSSYERIATEVACTGLHGSAPGLLSIHNASSLAFLIGFLSI